MFENVIDFWFNRITPKQRWQKDEQFDRQLEKDFGDLLESASKCELYEWRVSPRGRLAEIIILDQFSRNIFRGKPKSFAQDPLALSLSQHAYGISDSKELKADEKIFLYMPYMHSESKKIHLISEQIFKELGIEQNYKFALDHKSIIDRFGRYPHRNEILGRESSKEEIDFLNEPGSSF
ncbi:MAG: DUF924 domain-containing protein [Leptospira sp.]|nr:DUF924 domain-containing protein [Leptospira sp.]